MKQLFFSLLILISLLPASAGVINKTYTFNSSKVSVDSVIQDGGRYSQVTYDGLDNLDAVGEPSLPVKSVLFKVPDNAINISVTAEVSGGIISSLPDSISYTLPITTDGVRGTVQRLTTKYPVNQAGITSIGYVGGNRKVVGVNVYPLAVMPDGKTLISYGQVKVKISYSLGTDTTLTTLTPKSTAYRNEVDNFLRANVENPLLVNAAPIDMGISPLTVDQEDYDYIIITPARYVKSMERLAAMRRTQGYGAKVFSLESVLNFHSDYHPNNEIDDDAGKLRHFIKYAYEGWGTRDVLLAGKYPEMPVRYAWSPMNLPNMNEIEGRIPADIYFADLNANWTTGSKLGTYIFAAARPDIFNEVNVGRLNISSNPEQEIDNYINKVKKYEFVNPLTHPEYYGQALMSMQPYDTAGFPDDYYHEAKESLETVYGSGLINISPRNDGDVLTGSMFINTLNTQHPGAIALYGHGNAGVIALDKNVHFVVGLDAYDKWIASEPGNGLDNLTIPDYPSWFFTVACYIMPYDYMDENGTVLTLPYNFADSYTLASPSGGVALFGNSRASWMREGQHWSKEFFQILNETSKSSVSIPRAGNVLYRSLYNTRKEHDSNREIYVKGLTGDPLCRLRAKIPSELQISEQMVQDDGSIIYKVGTNELLVYMGRQPFIDATYALRGIAINNDSVLAKVNEVTSVYTSNSAPYILPLHIKDFTWWQYSCPYIFADDVFIGNENENGSDNVYISSGSEVTIEAMGDVDINHGLYICDNATLNIIADGIVLLNELHIGENATLNITAWDILNDKGWAINDGAYNYTFTRLCEQNQAVAPQEATNRQVADEYKPMVVEGRTWWIHTHGYLGWWDRENYKDYEVGFTIGSEVEIDGVKWNKLYVSHYREMTKHPNGIKWTEDETLLGYMREADRQVYVKMKKYDDETYGHPHFQDLFGPYALMPPSYDRLREGKEMLIYDFNNCEYVLGSQENLSDTEGLSDVCRFISKSIFENSGITYTKHKFGYYDYVTPDEEHLSGEVDMVEGIGLTQADDILGECLFFLPFADPEWNSLSPLALRYVTDKDGNIIYEQEGGLKLWDEMAGVQDVAKPNDGDAAAEWYNLQGIRIAQPTSPGVYIIRSGNESRKVVIK